MHLFNRDNSNLRSGTQVILRPLEGPALGEDCFEIADIRFGNKVICYLKGVERREQAENLIPFALYMQRDDLAPPGEGEFYLTDLVGVEVRDALGRAVGRVLGTYPNGAQEVLQVQWEGREVDIPLVSAFVLNQHLDGDESERWIQLICPQNSEDSEEVK